MKRFSTTIFSAQGTILGGEIQGRGSAGKAPRGILDPPKAPKSKNITKTLKLKLLVTSRSVT